MFSFTDNVSFLTASVVSLYRIKDFRKRFILRPVFILEACELKDRDVQP